MYSQKFLDRFLSPRNIGLIKGAGAVGSAVGKNAEQVKLYLKVENEVVIDAKFKVFGSPEIIVLFDCFLDDIKNVQLENLTVQLAERGVNNFSEIDTNSKIEFCLLAKDLIESSIKDYRKKQLRLQKLKEQNELNKIIETENVENVIVTSE